MARSSKSILPADLAKLLQDAQTHVTALRDIGSICILWSWKDASQVIESGAVLLGFSTIKDDEEGEGFRFLLGLPTNIQANAYLQNFFPGAK